VQHEGQSKCGERGAQFTAGACGVRGRAAVIRNTPPEPTIASSIRHFSALSADRREPVAATIDDCLPDLAAMRLFGIELRAPGSWELTAAVVLGTGLWVAAVGLLHAAQVEIGRFDAGALLVVALWACIAARMGIRVGQGHRHLLANVCMSAVLLGLYQGAWWVGTVVTA
jgi:hypothetical protein